MGEEKMQGNNDDRFVKLHGWNLLPWVTVILHSFKKIVLNNNRVSKDQDWNW